MNMTHNLVHKCILSFRGYIFIKMSNFKCLYTFFKESPRFRVPRKHVQSRKRYHNLKIHEIYLTPTYIY